MFHNLIRYPIESPLLKWESKVVVRDQDREAQLYLRLKLTGTVFPLFNSIPFVQVGKVRACLVDIAEDGLSVRAYFDSALPEDGAFVAIENLIDDERRENAFGLLMSLNMLIEFGDAFDFTFADFKGWCQRRDRLQVGPHLTQAPDRTDSAKAPPAPSR